LIEWIEKFSSIDKLLRENIEISNKKFNYNAVQNENRNESGKSNCEEKVKFIYYSDYLELFYENI
jgi:hypothetical protein